MFISFYIVELSLPEETHLKCESVVYPALVSTDICENTAIIHGKEVLNCPDIPLVIRIATEICVDEILRSIRKNTTFITVP